MTKIADEVIFSTEELMGAIAEESHKFQECSLWLEKAMPQGFFQEISRDKIFLIAHGLMGFDLQDYFSTVNLRRGAIVLCLDSPDADVKILRNYRNHGIKNYQAYVSSTPPPFSGITQNLRIAVIYFTEAVETVERPYPDTARTALRQRLKQQLPSLTDTDFEDLMHQMNTLFLRTVPVEHVVQALSLFLKAKNDDHCQYTITRHKEREKDEDPSVHIVLAWKNTLKNDFLYLLTRMTHRYNLVVKAFNATYINPYTDHNVLLLSLGLHGADNKSAWEACDLDAFLRELVALKYFDAEDRVDTTFVRTHLLSAHDAHLLRCMVNLIHQNLGTIDPYLYSFENVEEGLCRHPEISCLLVQAFHAKFDPKNPEPSRYQDLKTSLMNLLEGLDTGQPSNDSRRRNVLLQGIHFIDYTLKTNFFRTNKTAIAFRLDPHYLEKIPKGGSEKFSDLPHAIFYLRGMNFFGYHIRFKELSRGGLRTIFPEQAEQATMERNTVFSECYHLAWTQQKKNKDLPEGGSKGVIFLQPFDLLDKESDILRNELKTSKVENAVIEEKLSLFRKAWKVEYLHQAQRAYVDSLLTLVNSDERGNLKAKDIVDYWKRPEYLYLGPDENMHNTMIQWIADLSKAEGYKPGSAFISSKPIAGINHKEYGVTSLGLHVYVEEVLRFLGIDPNHQSFTVKMSGGPDGDVAGNEIMNLYRRHPRTAKLIALTDVSGTIFDPEGLDLAFLANLFHKELPIRHYPSQKLSENGFLLDREARRSDTTYSQQTLLYRKKGGTVVEEWLNANAMHQLYKHNIHTVKADIFIPGGGRPKTLNENNIQKYLDENGRPTSKAIVEGANLYLTPEARRFLEQKGVLIVKDSSANKGGVISSSFEVLCSLVLGDDLFVRHKTVLIEEILERVQQCSYEEARLLLDTHRTTGKPMTEISETISALINKYTYDLLDYLDTQAFDEAYVPILLAYALPTLRREFRDKLLQEVPEHHKKAIVACHLAAHAVYERGIGWAPSIIDVLPALIHEDQQR